MTNFPAPSELMRNNRPYLFSDSFSKDAYILRKSEFSHHLASLTERNQHQDFEVFARKLCEREICPNLRPQTGPEGGGDGKVDTETYPVADEVSERWFLGEANAGNERWGFAFSAKKTWSGKVRSDVKGMVETGREYDKIFFLTSRPARSKDRLRIEAELTERYGVPVTIHDRSWILDRVFENGHQDLAHVHLKAGIFEPEKLVIGPNDFKRRQELDVLEVRLAKSGHTGGEIMQSIADSLEAALLSRMLERPRIETTGRFERAIQLAKKYGTKIQEMRAYYERVWTIFWWFDEVDAINEDYETIEELAFRDNHADEISKLCNLYTVLSGRVRQGWETAEHLDLMARGERLRAKIGEICKDNSRPNNALYGLALHHLFKLSEVSSEDNQTRLDDVWSGLSDVVDRAAGMGEFPAELVDEVVEAMQPYTQASEAFDMLIIKVAEFMGERAREGKAGQLYLRRGEQRMEAEEPIEAIRWLGKASVYFMKEEYREEQFNTLYYLSVSYRSAGLLWAARATSLSAIVQATVLSDEPSGPRLELIPAATLFVTIAIQLGRIVDALTVIQWLHGLNQMLPLAEESRLNLQKRFQEFDQLLACLFVNLDHDDLRKLSNVPDVLDKLQLFFSRMILMHLLGHAEALKEDGSIPPKVPTDELAQIAEMAAVQPAARDLPKKALMYERKNFSASTIVLGVDVDITGGLEIDDHLICETHICALECFAATALETGAIAHAESLSIQVVRSKALEVAAIEFKPESMIITVNWPNVWNIRDVKAHGVMCDHLIDFCARVFDAVAIVNNDKKSGFFSQVSDELVLQRTTSFSNACIGNYRLFGMHASTLQSLNHLADKSYPLKDTAPRVTKGEYLDNEEDKGGGFTDPYKIVQRHNGYEVNSVINLHLWDKAGWNGMLFGDCGQENPPILALMFKSIEVGNTIFDGWIAKFGHFDESDAIRLSLLQGIDRENPSHYRACISKDIDLDSADFDPSKKYIQATRMLTMEPSTSENLTRFLSDFDRFKHYLLVPAYMKPDGRPEFLLARSILKRKLLVCQAWQIGPNDQESIAIRLDDRILIPKGIENPPCEELADFKRTLQSRST